VEVNGTRRPGDLFLTRVNREVRMRFYRRFYRDRRKKGKRKKTGGGGGSMDVI
jgi:hypothetical protein